MSEEQPQSKGPDDPGKSGEAQLRTDGPTPEAWVKAGYDMKDYPPSGYAAKPSAANTTAYVSTATESGTAAVKVGAQDNSTDAVTVEVKTPVPLSVPQPGASIEERMALLERVVHTQIGHAIGVATVGTHGLLYRWWEDMKAFFDKL